MKMGDIGPKNFKKFRKLYDEAVEAKKEQFEFEGEPVLVKWAKYVIEYLEPKLIKAGWIKPIRKVRT